MKQNKTQIKTFEIAKCFYVSVIKCMHLCRNLSIYVFFSKKNNWNYTLEND